MRWFGRRRLAHRDPRRFSEWQKGVIAGRMDEPGSPSVGAVRQHQEHRLRRPARHFPRPRTSKHPRRGVCGDRRSHPGHRRRHCWTLSDTPARLTIAIDFEGRGIGTILGLLLVRRAARKEMPANLAAL